MTSSCAKRTNWAGCAVFCFKDLVSVDAICVRLGRLGLILFVSVHPRVWPLFWGFPMSKTGVPKSKTGVCLHFRHEPPTLRTAWS